MCGICGKLNFDRTSVSSSLLRRMCDQISHRGPDDSGIYVSEAVGLGQTRLSVNDLRHDATPPLTNEDESIWLVFNGEIYNYKKLRDELIAYGHVFRTQTDTEVIIHAYEEYGHECLSHFNGMFAFALWDSARQELFCARDRFGKKPFCYTINSDHLIFGSEIKAIAADPDFTSRPDFMALDVYLSYGYIPSPMSAFVGVRKLQPGCYLVCKADGTHVTTRYWSPPFVTPKRKISSNEAKAELKERIRDAVRLRMVADVPLGAFLSGGIDSTGIVALMALQSMNPVKTFSIGFEDDAKSELPYARLLSERYHTEHHEFVVKPDSVDVLPKLVRHFNEPFADSSAIPTYYISKMAKSHVTVALTGDGGDEIFAGYGRYADMSRWNGYSRRCRHLRPLVRAVEWSVDALPYGNSFARIGRGLHMLSHDMPSQYALQMSVGLKPSEKRQLYTKEFAELISLNARCSHVFDMQTKIDMDPIEYCMLHDQNYYLPDELMVKTDIASMANSLEVRSPLLDYELAEFVATLPVELKYKNGRGKWILREVFRELLPDKIFNKAKTGFSIPKAKWLRGDLSSLAHDVLLSGSASQRNIFKPTVIARMLHEHRRGTRDWGNRLWTILMLEMWFREFMDK